MARKITEKNGQTFASTMSDAYSNFTGFIGSQGEKYNACLTFLLAETKVKKTDLSDKKKRGLVSKAILAWVKGNTDWPKTDDGKPVDEKTARNAKAKNGIKFYGNFTQWIRDNFEATEAANRVPSDLVDRFIKALAKVVASENFDTEDSVDELVSQLGKAAEFKAALDRALEADA